MRPAGFILTILPLTASLNTVLNVEEINSIHYAVDILNTPVVKDQAWEGEVMTIVNKHGQEYLCSLPPVPAISESDSRRDDDILDQLVDISVLLKPMETAPCLIKTVDWWTYEFCYGSVIKQYHLEDNKASGAIIILGKYESEYNWRNSSETKNRLQRFHSQFYVNGTKCDLTGEPRRTEVRFHCEDGVGDYMQRVDEPESCRYIVTIATTRVCHHPYLRMQAASTPHSITCAPALTSAQHHRYLVLHHKKQEEEENQKKKWLEENAEILKETGRGGSRKKNPSSLLQPIPDLEEGRGGDDDDMKMNIKIFRLSPVKKQGGGKGGQQGGVEVQPTDVMEVETQITLEEADENSDNYDDTTASMSSGAKTEGQEDTTSGVAGAGVGAGQGGAELLSNMEEEELLRLLGASQSAAVNTPNQQTGDSYLNEEDELEEDDDDADEDEEELVRTGEGRQGSKSTRRDHFSRIHKRLRHLGNMFANQEAVTGKEGGEGEGENDEAGEGLDKFGELQRVIERIKEGHMKDLDKEVQQWRTKFLNKEGVLDVGETDGEEDEGVGTALTSLMAALEEAEKKLNSAKQDVETLEEFLETKLEEIEGEGITTDAGGEGVEGEDPIEGTTPVPHQDPQNSEGSSKDTKKDSEIDGVSQQLRMVKGNKEDESQKTKLEQTIKDRLQKLGLEKIGRKFEVKIVTGSSLEEDETNTPLLSQEETHAFQNMIVNLLSANAEELEERENHRKLEKNYAFKWDDEQLAQEEEEE